MKVQPNPSCYYDLLNKERLFQLFFVVENVIKIKYLDPCDILTINMLYVYATGKDNKKH